MWGQVRVKQEERSGPNEVPARRCGGSTSEHDYVMRSRSRDRTSSTREPREFHLTSGNALLFPNERSVFDVPLEKNVLSVSDPSEHSKSP